MSPAPRTTMSAMAAAISEADAMVAVSKRNGSDRWSITCTVPSSSHQIVRWCWPLTFTSPAREPVAVGEGAQGRGVDVAVVRLARGCEHGARGAVGRSRLHQALRRRRAPHRQHLADLPPRRVEVRLGPEVEHLGEVARRLVPR